MFNLFKKEMRYCVLGFEPCGREKSIMFVLQISDETVFNTPGLSLSVILHMAYVLIGLM